jgi:murein DD-endopeptidase MepM/ murein hydrolase activator NlpD
MTSVCLQYAIRFFIIVTVQWLFINTSSAAEVYKYKDADGKWHYTDQKPEKTEAVAVNYNVTEKTKIEPRIFKQVSVMGKELVVENPLHTPIELLIKSPQISANQQHRIIPPQTIRRLLTTAGAIAPYTYYWQLGDPNAKPETQLYGLPLATTTCHKISQGFNGKFTHNKAHSQYAVDIALPVGTPIIAAREGVVIFVKDDYHMGGVNDYFLDKANHIEVLHSDGTFAIYAHILLGTAAVKPGDQVKKGGLLAKSGSSGYSSGPHLHFVIHRNAGLHLESIPFNFVDNKGNNFVPTEGKTICNF